MSKLIEKINKEQIRTDIPEFRVGDTIKVGVKISEKDSKGNVKVRVMHMSSFQIGIFHVVINI